MPNIVGEDQDYLHIQTDAGQIVPVLKSAVDSDALRAKFGQSPEVSVNMAATPPSPDLAQGPMLASNGPMTPDQMPKGSSSQDGPSLIDMASGAGLPDDSSQPGSRLPASAGASASWDASDGKTKAENPGQAPSSSGAPANAVFAKVPESTVPAGMTDDYAKQFQSGHDQQVKGIEQSADAATKSAQANAAYLQETQKQYQASMLREQQNAKERDDYSNQALADIKKSQDEAYKAAQIDPNRVFHQMGTGSKIAAAIGIALGGMSSALTGQANPALGIIEKAIDRDMEAQKANAANTRAMVSDKMNLYGLNLKRFGDKTIAEDATRSQLLGMANLQAQQMASQQAAGQAQGAKNQQLGQLNQAYVDSQIKLKQSLMTQKMQQQLAQGDQATQDPASYVRFVVPEAHQKQVFDEIGQAQNAAKNKDELMRNFDEAAKQNTVLRTGAGWVRTPPSVMSMRALTLPLIHDSMGRVNDFEQKTTMDLEPKPGDTDAKVAAKRHAYQAFVEQKMAAPTAKGFGIDLSKFSSTADDSVKRLPPEQQRWVAWARSNPGDTRAQALLEKLGVK